MSNDLKYTISLKDLFTKQMNDAIKSTDRLDSKMGSMFKSVLGANIATNAIQRLGSGIIDFAKDTVRAVGQAEQFNVALKTMLHGNAGEAMILNKQLINLAKTTPFQLTEVQAATRQMIAYGFETKNMVSTMTMLGDVSSGVSAPIEDITYLYGTLKTQGKVFSRDLYQFANRGIPLIGELAKQFKVSEASIFEMASNGQISFADVEKSFKSMTSTGGIFFNMMSDQSKTLVGKTSNLADSWEQLKIKIGSSQTGILNSTVDWATKMVTNFTNMMSNHDKMMESFSKYGGEYNILDKIGSFLSFGAVGAKAKDTRYQDAIQKQFVNPSSESLSAAIKSKQSLANIAANMYQDKSLDKNSESFKRTMAIIKGALSDVTKNIETLTGQGKKSESLKNGTITPTVKTALGTGVEVTAARPQNLTINITKLIETMNLRAADLRDSAIQIKEEVAKALLEAVNDVNTVTR